MECSSLRNLSCECLLFCVYCVCLSWSKSKVWGITQPSNEISKISKISQLLSSLKATFIFFVFVVPYSTKERIWFLRKSLHIFLLFGSSNSNNHVSIMLLFNVTFLGARKRFKIFFSIFNYCSLLDLFPLDDLYRLCWASCGELFSSIFLWGAKLRLREDERWSAMSWDVVHCSCFSSFLVCLLLLIVAAGDYLVLIL